MRSRFYSEEEDLRALLSGSFVSDGLDRAGLANGWIKAALAGLGVHSVPYWNSWEKVARPDGFEPPTLGFEDRYSIGQTRAEQDFVSR